MRLIAKDSDGRGVKGENLPPGIDSDDSINAGFEDSSQRRLTFHKGILSFPPYGDVLSRAQNLDYLSVIASENRISPSHEPLFTFTRHDRIFEELSVFDLPLDYL